MEEGGQAVTQETDALIEADQHHIEDDNWITMSCYWRMSDLARTLERERDEWRKKAVDLHKRATMNKIDRLLFIYAKEGEIIVLNSDEAKYCDIVTARDWKHTMTIDPQAWIENMVNEGPVDEMIAELKGEEPTEQSAIPGDLSAISTRNSP